MSDTGPGPNEIVDLPVPDDWTKLFESRFLHAADLGGRDVVLKIERMVFEEMPDPKTPKARKKMGSLVFEGRKKILGLNRTNATCLKQMFGPKLVSWVGKRVGLYPTTVRMPKPGSREMVDEPCIRVRGSPDIEAEIVFELILPQRAPTTVKLQRLVAAEKKP